jgi:hypothetical protein
MHTGAGLTLGRIPDLAGMQAEDRVLTEQEERELNEQIFFRWRPLLAEMG